MRLQERLRQEKQLLRFYLEEEEYRYLMPTNTQSVPCIKVLFVMKKILEVFGDDITSTSGDIDPKKLAGIVFQDNSKREQLNAIVHPFVLEGMQKFFITNLQQPIICAEVPLLFETGWDQYFDRTVVVTCSEENCHSKEWWKKETTHLKKRGQDFPCRYLQKNRLPWQIK